MRASKSRHAEPMLRQALLAALLLLATRAAAAVEPLQLLRVTPSGTEVPAGNQIVLSFDRAMVALGRMERSASEVPVTIAPAVNCQWRWLDVQTLACNLPAASTLQASTAYTVVVADAFTALDGSRLPQALTQRFTTETAKVQWAEVGDWQGPTAPTLRLRFSQPVTAASIAGALSLDGVAVRALADPLDADTPFYTPNGEARALWRVQSASPLAADHRYALRIKPGLQSAFGPELGSESRVIETLQTYAAPRLLGLQCSDGQNMRVVTADTRCAPLDGVALLFNVPVASSALAAAVQLTPDPRSAPASSTTDDDEDATSSAPAVSGAHRGDERYAVPLPVPLAAETQYRLNLVAGLKDRFGRAVGGIAPLRFGTGARTPRLVFEHSPAVLEAGVDSEVPVIVTNLDSLQTQFRRYTADGVSPEQTQRTAVASVRNLAFAMPLPVRELLQGHSGALIGGLSSTPATGKKPLPLFAEVTPWQVHAKLGNANLLVWVTGMADGKPVADAEVSVLDQLDGSARSQGRTDRDGLVQLAGSRELDPQLERQYASVNDPQRQPLWLRVTRGKDLALLPLSYDFQVDTWRSSREQISEWRRAAHGHLRSWGATAQGVYRAGDTVQYKLYVRDDAERSLQPARRGPYTLRVIDPTGAIVEERSALQLSAFGAIDGAFTLAQSAAVGWYRFELAPDYAKDLTLEPMRVLVSDFVPAPFHVQAELRATQVQPGSTLVAQVQAQLHGGGPFAKAPAQLRARVQSVPFTPDDPLARSFSFDTWQRDGRETEVVLDTKAALDAQGQWSAPLTLKDSSVLAGELVLEGSVQDDRGRSIVGSTRIPYFGRDRYIGIRQSGWPQTGKPAQIETVVVDRSGKPLARVPYLLSIERKITKGARVKSAGNAYVTRYFSQWQRVATCQGRSSSDGNVCSFTPDAGGELRAIAMVRDSHNRLHQSSSWMYAQGSNEVLWEESPDYALDLRVDRAQYQVGDTARLFVKNPYPGATALITVERYGVLERRTEVLKTATPVIELKIKPEYLPGAYVSVVVMSPRVAAPVKAHVDLGKPSFRMGYATLKVVDPYRELQVQVTPAKKQLRPRETVRVDLVATPRNGAAEPGAQPIAQPIEFAVAVLDEAVFDLIRGGTGYFDPLRGFTQLDGLDLSNYSLITRLVGRQKFEKKGASSGGDGGADLSLRSIEKFVAYWNPGLKADAQGRAQFTFTTPDNLSGWRVLAMAVTPGDRMGLGQGKIAVSKPTELRALLPAQLMRGDSVDASFSLMNRAVQPRTLDITLQASGAASASSTQKLKLQPYERRTLSLPLRVTQAGVVHLLARAGDAQDRDALQQDLVVRERPLTITAADFSPLTADAPISLAVQPPAGASAVQLRVDLAGSLLGQLDGAFQYLADYPYLCWEQRLSKAVMAAQYQQLRGRSLLSLSWPQAAGLPKAMLGDAATFQAPGGGMSFFVAEDRYQSPYLSAYTALAFGWLQTMGDAPPVVVWDKLDAYLQKLLREDRAAPGYDNAESRAQVRAIALAALAQHGKLALADLQRYQSQLPRMGLFGEALYAQAADSVDGAQALQQTALTRVLARGQQSAASLLLRDDANSDEAWLLGSGLRSNCAALSALLRSQQAGDGELAAKLARAIAQARGAHPQWPNTQENVYCSRALIDYAQRYEQAPLQLQVTATLDQKMIGSAALKDTGSAAISAPLAAGSKAQALQLSASGSGRVYAMTTLRYAGAPPLLAVDAGLAVERRYYVRRDDRWQPLSGALLQVRKGEQLKIELNLTVPVAMNYLVVDDPVPAGLEAINPDLATASGFAADELQSAGPAYPYPFYHRELRFDAARFYAERVEAGRYQLAWLAQAVASGEFAVNETHAERMYDPDVFGNGVATRLRVMP